MQCSRDGKCEYNLKWMTGVNFCARPACPYAGKAARRKEARKREK